MRAPLRRALGLVSPVSAFRLFLGPSAPCPLLAAEVNRGHSESEPGTERGEKREDESGPPARRDVRAERRGEGEAGSVGAALREERRLAW